jgi:hypothetical protein
MRAEVLDVSPGAGVVGPSRFCSRCNALHGLSAFDEGRHTCAAGLQHLQEQRQQASAARRHVRSGGGGSRSAAAAAAAAVAATPLDAAGLQARPGSSGTADGAASEGACTSGDGAGGGSSHGCSTDAADAWSPEVLALFDCAAYADDALVANGCAEQPELPLLPLLLRGAPAAPPEALGALCAAPLCAHPPPCVAAVRGAGAAPAPWASDEAWPWVPCGYGVAALKLPLGPEALPAAGLRAQLTPALFAEDLPEEYQPVSCREGPLALYGAVRPGCTLLTLDALLRAGGGGTGAAAGAGADGAMETGGMRDARRALAAMLVGAPAVAAAAASGRVTLACATPGGSGGSGHAVTFAAAAGGALLDGDGAVAAAMESATRFAVTPRVLLSTAACTLRVSRAGADAAAGAAAAAAAAAAPPRTPLPLLSVRCRVGGRYITTSSEGDATAGADGGVRVTLPPLFCNGCVLVETEEAEAVTLRRAPACVLLCAYADVVAEVASTEAALRARATGAAAAGAAGADDATADSDAHMRAFEGALATLGCALAAVASLEEEEAEEAAEARRPRAELFAAAAAAAMRFGWRAAAARCLDALQRALQAREEEYVDEKEWVARATLCPRSGASLLHQAAAAGDAGVLAATLAAPARVRGAAFGAASPSARAGAGATPLHAAAARRDAGAAAALCADGDGAGATLAWFTARDAAGATPRDLALLDGAVACAAMLALDARLRAALAAACAAAHAAAAAARNDDDAATPLAAASSARRVCERARAALLAADAPASPHAPLAAALLAQLSHAAAAAALSPAAAAAFPVPHALALALPLSGDDDHVSREVSALRSSACVVLVVYALCAVVALSMPPVPHAAVLASLPEPPWPVWRRMPTMLCCQEEAGGRLAGRAAAALALAAVAFAPGGRARRLRAAHASTLVLVAILYFAIIDPSLCAAATHARYGAGVRAPWQAGAKQIIFTAFLHLAVAHNVPPLAYAALLTVRGALPLLARVVPGLGSTRVVAAAVAWDVAHAALTLAAAAHNAAAVTARRRRTAAAAAAAVAAAAHADAALKEAR